MRRWFRLASRLVFAVVALMFLGGSYFVFFDRPAIDPRPDLVRLPPSAPEAPEGYPTIHAAYLSYYLGLLEVIDFEAGAPTPEGVTEEIGVAFGTTGVRPLLLDLYQPEGLSEPVPGVIFVHGGSWRWGERKHCAVHAVDFAKRGYVTATIDYRLRQEAPFPAAVQDVN